EAIPRGDVTLRRALGPLEGPDRPRACPRAVVLGARGRAAAPGAGAVPRAAGPLDAAGVAGGPGGGAAARRLMTTGADTMERPKQRRGFASMSPEKQRAIASVGGRAAHRKG